MQEFGVRPAWECAYVVFSPRAGLWWLRLLRPGFRHCFVLLHDGVGLVAIEPLVSRISVSALEVPFGAEAFVRSLEVQGMTVVPARIAGESPDKWRFGIFTCVEVVKRVLGLRAPLAFTPWRLYRYLKLQHTGASK